MRKSILLLAATSMALGLLTLGGCSNSKKDKYTKDGKLMVSMRNLYFSSYKGGDSYIEEVENKFKLKFSFETYDWANWETQVTGSINGQNMEDVFHANIDSYNFATTYKFWAEEELVKPLPDDMSKWPNIQHVLENTSNIESLKVDGKLYGDVNFDDVYSKVKKITPVPGGVGPMTVVMLMKNVIESYEKQNG